ncbi:MAG: insulinase family protein [candidate division KSB1 bacterium]|nr:insulinase family protein [candidate division KSB1 bacterium]
MNIKTIDVERGKKGNNGVGSVSGFYCRELFAVYLAWVLLLAPTTRAGNVQEFSVNGLKVILKTNPANEIIAANLYIRGGVLNVTTETAGIEALLLDAATKGTDKYPKEKLNAELARLGTQISSEVKHDYSMISMRCVKTYFDRSWDIFADVILNPRLEAQEVELVRGQLLAALRQRHDHPDSHLEMLGAARFYQNHPYALSPEGTVESVSQITIAQMRQYLKDNLITSKLLLVIVGNVNQAALQNKIAAAFGRLPVGNYQPRYPPTVKHALASVHIEPQDLPTNYIAGYFSAPSQRDADYYAMRVAVAILQDRVFEEVRTKRNLSYAPEARLEDLFANHGKLYVTTVAPDSTIKIMLAEVKRLQNRLLDPEGLRDRINLSLTSYYLENETNAAQAAFLARFELAGLGWRASEKFVKNRQKVTPEQVRHVAQKYMNNFQFVVIGDPAKIDRNLFTSK